MNKSSLFLPILLISNISFSNEITILYPISCVDWNKAEIEMTKVSKNSALSTGLVNHVWLLGLLTGLNGGISTNKNYLRNIDGKTAIDWTTNYCKHNPKNDVFDAASKLILNLVEIEK